ncbi:nucleic acid-binding protein [Xylariomycetidae sp. FL0641]|nr:nucleic acid-binding protein [Xylariomycetidae sp. FL0641]
MSFLARRTASALAPSRLAATTRSFSASARRDIAKMTLVGNLANPPEVKVTSTGREVLEYSVASNDGRKDNPHTSWFRVSTFVEDGPRRQFLESLPKGTTVFVEGDAILNKSQDAEGKNHSHLNIYMKNLEVLRRPRPTEE